MTAATLTPTNASTAVPTSPPRRRPYGGVVPEPVAPLDSGVVLGLYGPGGVGKTTLVGTLADTELGYPVLLLNARGNPHVISSRADRIDVIHIKRFSQLEKIREGVMADPRCPYRSIVLDTVTELFAMDCRDLYGPTADVRWEKYEAAVTDGIQLTRNWTDVAMTKGINIVFIYQEVTRSVTVGSQKVEARSEILLSKTLKSHVGGIVTFLGRLYTTTDIPPRRVLDFTYNEMIHQVKFQVDPGDPVTSRMSSLQYDPSLASILDTVRGRQPWPTEKHQIRRAGRALNSPPPQPSPSAPPDSNDSNDSDNASADAEPDTE